MRIAFHSPLPPERSGIADYSFELLAELRDRVDVVAVVPDSRLVTAHVPDGVELVGLESADALRADCDLYQMGNNPKYHRSFWSRAFDEPGLLVLHDPSLADITSEMCGGADGAIFRAEVAYDRPDIAPDDDLPLVDSGDGRKDLDRLQVLLARRIVESNIRTLVHSSAMAREMRHRYGEVDVQTIQLPAPVLAGPHGGRERAPGEIVFGVFGGINYYKRVRPLVDAFAELRSRHPLARMVVAGRADDHLLERELRAFAARPELAGSLEVKTDLTLVELEREMLACDVGISLRWPTAGEMSATLMRTLGAGKPAIVSDVLQFRELDERYCWRVTTDFAEEHEHLVSLMARAAADLDGCRRAGEAARAFVAAEATYSVVADRYVEHLAHCASVRDRARAAHRSRSLRARRSAGVNVVCPVDGSEVAEAARRSVDVLRALDVDVVVVPVPPAMPAAGFERLEAWRELAGPGRDRPSAPHRRAPVQRPGRARTGATAPSAVERERAMRAAIRALDPADRWIQSSGPHAVDLLFVDPNEVLRYGRLARVRRDRGRRVVPVIVPDSVPLPAAYDELFEVAERVAVPSEFAADVARLGAASPVEVVAWLARPGACEQSEPAEPCTFVVVVDEGTTVARANPRAAIAAYRAAFAPVERGAIARLVVVLAGSGRRLEARAELAEELARLPGELVVDPEPAALARIVARADVYVSLHRAEGFGLRLADAMAAGKAVIATGWSGNLDYMDARCACLVGYEVAGMGGGEHYLDGYADLVRERGSFWVEPDVDGAARWMRLLAADAASRERLGAAAAARVGPLLAPAEVGPALRALVERVDAERPAGAPPAPAVRWPPPPAASGGAR
ncbi:MAG TPA: glycosyltransferase [Acidimicrobiales bacterium]|nr:glycosyltransferase [Acidimicrobiales bacterium]